MKITYQNNDGNILGETVLSDAEVTALETDMQDIAAWIDHAIRNKARKRINDIVTRSGRGSKYTDADLKLQIIDELKQESDPLVETAKQKEEKRLAYEAAKKGGSDGG